MRRTGEGIILTIIIPFIILPRMLSTFLSRKWLSRMGIASVVAFTIKGLAWVVFALTLAAKGC